jgi:hypothetical protein
MTQEIHPRFLFQKNELKCPPEDALQERPQKNCVRRNMYQAHIGNNNEGLRVAFPTKGHHAAGFTRKPGLKIANKWYFDQQKKTGREKVFPVKLHSY